MSFENENDRKSHSTYYLPKVETKDYNVMIDGKNFFGQPINSMTKTYENIRKITTGQGDDYATSCLIDYSYFKNHYKMIAIDLSKQEDLEADPRVIQQISFTANLDTLYLYLHLTNCHQTWWGGDWPWEDSTHKFTEPFEVVFARGHVIN